MQIEIVKDYKMMKAGHTPNVADTYGEALIKKGIAKKVAEKKEAKK